ncbi:hypothetical protein ACH4TE_19730 [Streptomyces sioyaensis]|uniref:hypothetical protein n=1 Tax=Streptomyces sioyaensis TaxID=67364 RepID=UPI0037973F03
MTHPTDTERAMQATAEAMVMFRIEPQPDNGAFLDIASVDNSGQMFRQRFTLDQLMVCALRGAMARDFGHVEMPPLRPEVATLLAADPSDHATRHAAAEACSRLLYRQIFPAENEGGAA